LAWLLAVLGQDFWKFNVMELFASIAILLGVLLAFRGWVKERRRKNSLIVFPDNWTAQRYLRNDVFIVQARVRVFLPHHAFHYRAEAIINKSSFPMQSKPPEQSYGSGASRRMEMTAPLASIPSGAKHIKVKATIWLDGDMSRSSGWRSLPIVVYPPDEGYVKEPQP
jgi:hypothetical protein